MEILKANPRESQTKRLLNFLFFNEIKHELGGGNFGENLTINITETDIEKIELLQSFLKE